jgi:hypothetical protein
LTPEEVGTDFSKIPLENLGQTRAAPTSRVRPGVDDVEGKQLVLDFSSLSKDVPYPVALPEELVVYRGASLGNEIEHELRGAFWRVITCFRDLSRACAERFAGLPDVSGSVADVAPHVGLHLAWMDEIRRNAGSLELGGESAGELVQRDLAGRIGAARGCGRGGSKGQTG